MIGKSAGADLFPENAVPDHQGIEAGRVERPDGVLGRTNDRLALEVEGRIQNRGNPGGLGEAFDELVVTRICVAKDSLQTAGSVDVRRCPRRGEAHRSGRGGWAVAGSSAPGVPNPIAGGR